MIFDPLRQGGGIPGHGPLGPFPPRYVCGEVFIPFVSVRCSDLWLLCSHPRGARFDPVSPLGPRPMPHPPGRIPPRNRGPPGFYGLSSISK